MRSSAPRITLILLALVIGSVCVLAIGGVALKAYSACPTGTDAFMDRQLEYFATGLKRPGPLDYPKARAELVLEAGDVSFQLLYFVCGPRTLIWYRGEDNATVAWEYIDAAQGATQRPHVWHILDEKSLQQILSALAPDAPTPAP